MRNNREVVDKMRTSMVLVIFVSFLLNACAETQFSSSTNSSEQLREALDKEKRIRLRCESDHKQANTTIDELQSKVIEARKIAVKIIKENENRKEAAPTRNPNSILTMYFNVSVTVNSQSILYNNNWDNNEQIMLPSIFSGWGCFRGQRYLSNDGKYNYVNVVCSNDSLKTAVATTATCRLGNVGYDSGYMVLKSKVGSDFVNAEILVECQNK